MSKGKLLSPFASLALYSSDRTASSPLTAYLASLTWGLMLLMLKLRSAVVVDILRCVNWFVLLPVEVVDEGVSAVNIC